MCASRRLRDWHRPSVDIVHENKQAEPTPAPIMVPMPRDVVIYRSVGKQTEPDGVDKAVLRNPLSNRSWISTASLVSYHSPPRLTRQLHSRGIAIKPRRATQIFLDDVGKGCIVQKLLHRGHSGPRGEV